MFNPKKNKKGFTIIELIVVIAIIAILAAIAIPTFIGLTDKANTAVATADARSIATAINAWNALNPNETQIGASDLSDTGALATKLSGLWPEGITDAATAVGLISFSNGVAIVNTSSGS